MKLREFEHKDYLEVVAMFKDFVATVYPNRKLGSDLAFYDDVLNWVKTGKHIFVVDNGRELMGFSVSSIDQNRGLTEPVYFGEICYVKPQFRKTKCAYLLYNNGSEIAQKLGIALCANAFISEDKVQKIQSKFGMKPTYQTMERSV